LVGWSPLKIVTDKLFAARVVILRNWSHSFWLLNLLLKDAARLICLLKTTMSIINAV